MVGADATSPQTIWEGMQCSCVAEVNGDWVRDNVGKGKLLEEMFSAKFVIPAAVTKSFSALEIVDEDVSQKISVIPPEDHIAKVLADLGENSSTGPDVIPAQILSDLPMFSHVRCGNC
jgi:hypothetical protein